MISIMGRQVEILRCDSPSTKGPLGQVTTTMRVLSIFGKIALMQLIGRGPKLFIHQITIMKDLLWNQAAYYPSQISIYAKAPSPLIIFLRKSFWILVPISHIDPPRLQFPVHIINLLCFMIYFSHCVCSLIKYMIFQSQLGQSY